MATNEHKLKCWSEFFIEIWNGKKDWELRKDDRNYKVGDILIQEEGNIYHDDFVRTGRVLTEEITFILRNQPQFGLQKGYCIMSTKELMRISPPTPTDGAMTAEEFIKNKFPILNKFSDFELKSQIQQLTEALTEINAFDVSTNHNSDEKTKPLNYNI